MTTSPKITVVTVCFNSAATIENALRSVAEQTWPAVEHIVIDGGSTDGTQAIIERYADALAHYISEPDKGIYDAMNKGARLASGDYLAFLNSDDVYAHPDVVAHVANMLLEHAVDAVFGDVEFVRPDAPERVVRRYSSTKFNPQNLRSGWMMAHPSLFLRTDLIRRAGFFDPTYRIAGDFELVARIFKDRSITYRYSPEIFVRMQLGGASTSGLPSLMRINREIMRACRENGIATNWARLLSRYPSKLLELVRVQPPRAQR